MLMLKSFVRSLFQIALFVAVPFVARILIEEHVLRDQMLYNAIYTRWSS